MRPPLPRPDTRAHQPPTFLGQHDDFDGFLRVGRERADVRNVGFCAPSARPHDGRGPGSPLSRPPQPTPAATPPTPSADQPQACALVREGGPAGHRARQLPRQRDEKTTGWAGLARVPGRLLPSRPHISHLGEPLEHGAAPDRAAAGHDAAAAGGGRDARAGAQATPRGQRGARRGDSRRRAHRAAGRERAAGAGTQQHVGSWLGRRTDGGLSGKQNEKARGGVREVLTTATQPTEFVLSAPRPRQTFSSPHFHTACVSTRHHRHSRHTQPGVAHARTLLFSTRPCFPRRPPAPRLPRPPRAVARAPPRSHTLSTPRVEAAAGRLARGGARVSGVVCRAGKVRERAGKREALASVTRHARVCGGARRELVCACVRA